MYSLTKLSFTQRMKPHEKNELCLYQKTERTEILCANHVKKGLCLRFCLEDTLSNIAAPKKESTGFECNLTLDSLKLAATIPPLNCPILFFTIFITFLFYRLFFLDTELKSKYVEKSKTLRFNTGMYTVQAFSARY